MGATLGEDLAGIDLAHCDDFSLGAIRVVPCECSLRAGDANVHLEPKVMQVLVALAREPGAVLSRDDLVEIVWEGRIVGDASINRALSHLRAAIEKLGNGSVTIETLSKVGYRLRVDGAEPLAVESVPRLTLSKRSRLALVGLLLVGVLATVAWFAIGGSKEQRPVHVVVLPIEAGSASELAAAGVEAQLRDELARSVGLVVNTSGSVASLVEEGRSPREIAAALEADFVLSGRIETSDARSHLALTLHSAESDVQIWSEDIAQPAQSVGQILPRAVRAVRLALGIEPEGDGDLPELDHDEYIDYVLALGIVRSRAQPAAPTAQRILENLLETHGEFVPGLVALAQLRLTMRGRPSVEEDSRNWVTGGALLDRALALDPEHPQALGWRGYYSDGDIEERLGMAQRAVTLDPGDVRILQFHAVLANAAGYTAEALETYETLARIDPLWIRSLQAYDMAIELGERERAAETMTALRAVITDPDHLALLDSAEARAEGDLSRALAILLRLRSANSPAQRQTAHFYAVGIRAELGLTGGAGDPPMNQPPLFLHMLRNDVPDRTDFLALDIGTRQFWDIEIVREFAPPAYVMTGRSEMLVDYYDDFADGPNDFLDKLPNQEFDFFGIAPYLALALDEVGRPDEANEVREIAHRIDTGYASRGPRTMGARVRSAALDAVSGREEQAIYKLLEAREMGWPYHSAWLHGRIFLSRFDEDPAFAVLKGDPRFDAMAREIEATRQRERSEALVHLTA